MPMSLVHQQAISLFGLEQYQFFWEQFWQSKLSISRAQKEEIPFASKSAVSKMILIVACLAVFPWLIETVGFYLTSGMLFFFLLYVVEKESLKFSLISAVLSFFLLWLIFEVILKVQLPLGFMTFMRFI